MDGKYIYNDSQGIPDLETFIAVRNAADNHGIISLLQKDRISLMRTQKITYLRFSSKRHQISNLDFLKFFPNLDSLIIENQRLRDLSGLKYVPKLDELHLWDMHINSVAPIAECSTLGQLMMYKVRVMNVDIFELRTLNYLEILSLENCGVTDLSWISDLTNLTDVVFEGNNICHFAPLKNLPNLKSIAANSDFYDPPFDELPD